MKLPKLQRMNEYNQVTGNKTIVNSNYVLTVNQVLLQLLYIHVAGGEICVT